MNRTIIPQRRSPNGQLTPEEMFNIIDHKGNANQNHTDIPTQVSQNGHCQENKNVGEDMGEKEPSYTFGWKVN
jgi:hypothetical protein